jgi:hypothetical protein
VRIDILEAVARGLLNDTPAGRWLPMPEIERLMTPEDVALLPPVKNRSRDIAKAFGGAKEYLTTAGRLNVKKESATKLVYRLTDPQLPQSTSEEDTSD